MTDKTWKHGEHIITMLPNGQFCTHQGGKALTTTSLDGMKKKLDKLASFKQFDVIYYRYGRFDPEYRKVVGVRSVRGKKLFVLDNAREVESVILDTPAHRKAIKEYNTLRAANSKNKETMDAAERDARAFVTFKRPE